MNSINEQKETCTDKECLWCLEDLPHPYSDPPIPYTTIVFSSKGKVYDLSKGESISGDEMCVNAFTCTEEEAKRYKDKAAKK